MTLIYILAIIIFIIVIINLPRIKGSFGELKVSTKLKSLGNDYFSLNDILIKNEEGYSSQIDHLVLSVYGIFVIETKNYKGWIFGNEKSENWTQIIFDGKYNFRNPVRQNWSHIYTLKKILSDYKDIKYFPIVVFSGNAVFKNIKSTVPVIYDTSLCYVIKNETSSVCLSIEKIYKIKEVLENNNLSLRKDRKKHIKAVKLRKLERKRKTENLICPLCDGELKLRNGKYGKFYGCSNYPYCKFTRKY